MMVSSQKAHVGVVVAVTNLSKNSSSKRRTTLVGSSTTSCFQLRTVVLFLMAAIVGFIPTTSSYFYVAGFTTSFSTSSSSMGGGKSFIDGRSTATAFVTTTTKTTTTSKMTGTNLRKDNVIIGSQSIQGHRHHHHLDRRSSPPSTIISTLFMSSYSSDGSEYSSTDDDYYDDDDDEMRWGGPGFREKDEVETIECQPVPMSKNAGNRIVALYWDHELKGPNDNRDPWDLHYAREDLNEDHVMFCRKCNLYNETFNTDSMVDIMKSLPILASDLQRVVGHCLVMETPDIKYVHDVLKDDPVLRSLTDDGERLRDVPIYRWRHIRDHTLRIDDGRLGFPCMMVGLDDEPEIVGNTRIETRNATLEHMIRSEKVIAAGPLHLPTSLKDDPSSIAVGDLVMFNAKDREDAISFVETMPSAMAGLYKDLRVHFYNDLDVTGKFVSEDPMRDAPGYQMKEAMEYWGYPVDDDQTPWLNW